MNEFQLPIFFVFIIVLFISLALNKYSLNFKQYFKQEKNDSEIRLSNVKVPTFGGISMSVAFLVSTRLLGKVDTEIMQIAFYAVFITLIGFLDDKYNLNWKLKLLLQFFAVSMPIYILNLYLNIEMLLGINFDNNLNLLVTIIWV